MMEKPEQEEQVNRCYYCGKAAGAVKKVQGLWVYYCINCYVKTLPTES